MPIRFGAGSDSTLNVRADPVVDYLNFKECNDLPWKLGQISDEPILGGRLCAGFMKAAARGNRR